MERALPSARLRPYVREYVGWWDRSGLDVCRREPPGDLVPLIINFGSKVRIYHDDGRARWRDFDSFTTGVFDTYVLVGTQAGSGGLQANLTIRGARLILGQPLGALLNAAVSLDDIFGRTADALTSRLFEAEDWRARFAIIDAELQRRVDAVRRPPEAVMHASARLLGSGERRPIAALADEVGCSHKHLIDRFRHEFGVTPKTFARVLRFGRAVEAIKRGDRLADVAAACGYCDQSHLDREVQGFAGVTPSSLRNLVI